MKLQITLWGKICQNQWRWGVWRWEERMSMVADLRKSLQRAFFQRNEAPGSQNWQLTLTILRENKRVHDGFFPGRGDELHNLGKVSEESEEHSLFAGSIVWRSRNAGERALWSVLKVTVVEREAKTLTYKSLWSLCYKENSYSLVCPPQAPPANSRSKET